MWLKVLFIICTSITKSFIEIPPCAKKVIFITEFVLLDLNPHFYEVNQEVWKRPCAWRNFKNIFSRPLFTIIFRPKILILDTYSILSRYVNHLYQLQFENVFVHWLPKVKFLVWKYFSTNLNCFVNSVLKFLGYKCFLFQRR